MTTTKPSVTRSRKKAADAVPQAENETANAVEGTPRPAWIDGPAGEQPEPAEPPKTWADPYKATFTCPVKQYELGENRRYKQMVFKFADKPDALILGELKEAGFQYRAAEKAWTIPANASTREMATRMAHAWASPGQGVER